MATGRVVHVKREKYDVYIGRPSMWGNPFTIGKDGSREDVIKKYEEYARNDTLIQAYLVNLENKVLGCWCKPLPCHGDILIKLLAERGKTNGE